MSGSDFLLESQQSSLDSSLGLNSLTAHWTVTLGTSNVVHDGSATFSALSGDLLFASFNGTSIQVSNFQLGNLALTFTGGTLPALPVRLMSPPNWSTMGWMLGRSRELSAAPSR
jgi:hypothetical protein